MSDMKCPVCKTGNIREYADGLHYACDNEDCPSYDETDEKTFDVLIDTKKKLDVAVDALNKINMRCQNTVRNHLERATIRGELCDISFYARKAIGDIDNLERITALKQKDK